MPQTLEVKSQFNVFIQRAALEQEKIGVIKLNQKHPQKQPSYQHPIHPSFLNTMLTQFLSNFK
jgi:hypothetical protein